MPNDAVPTITISAPEGYKPTDGQPITFDVPVSSLDINRFAPKDIAEKPYFKDKVKSFDDLFKTLDGAQTLIGSRPKFAVPAADASDEEWNEFYKVSRPGKAEDYTFSEDPNAPAELKAPEEFKAKIKQMFFDAGIPPKMALQLQKSFDALTMDINKANIEKQKALDKDFMDKTKALVGEDPVKAKEAFDRSKEILAYILPKEMHPFISKINNDGMAVMVALSQAIQKKYLKEDEVPRGGGNGGGGTTKAELQSQARTKMEERNKLDAMDPRKNQLQKEIKDIYDQIALIK